MPFIGRTDPGRGRTFTGQWRKSARSELSEKPVEAAGGRHQGGDYGDRPPRAPSVVRPLAILLTLRDFADCRLNPCCIRMAIKFMWQQRLLARSAGCLVDGGLDAGAVGMVVQLMWSEGLGVTGRSSRGIYSAAPAERTCRHHTRRRGCSWSVWSSERSSGIGTRCSGNRSSPLQMAPSPTIAAASSGWRCAAWSMVFFSASKNIFIGGIPVRSSFSRERAPL